MKPIVLFVLVLLVTALIYWSGLQGPLIFDDAQNLGPVNDWLQGSRGWHSVVFENDSGLFGRPVSMLSFLLNASILGPGIWGFKVVNLAIHLCNGVLVYALCNVFAQRGGLLRQRPARAPWLALLAASIWLVHPLLVSTVLYVVQRMAMLSALFTFGAMLAYVHARFAVEEGRRRRAIGLFAIAGIATCMATLSKENGVLAPALCATIELFMFPPHAGSKRPRFARALILLALVVPALIAVGLVAVGDPHVTEGYANRPFTLFERLITQGRVLWSYVGSLAMPYGPKLGLYHDDYLTSHGLLDPPITSLALIAWMAVVAVAWRLRKSIPGFALGIAIFLVGHALESTVFPLLMYFEHRNYLPAMGAIWAAVSLGYAGAGRLQSRMHHGTIVFPAASVALVLVLGLATAARAGIWSSREGIVAQGLTYHPDSRWLRMDAARWALQQSPPNLDVAKAHVDHLRQSNEPETRRMGSAARLWIDCSHDRTATPEAITEAFSGGMRTIEADELIMFEALSGVVSAAPCEGLSPLKMAQGLKSMLDRARLPRDELNIRRLRFKSAQLFLQAGNDDAALVQARAATGPNKEDAPMAVFVAELELKRGNYDEASGILDSVERRISRDEYAGQGLIRRLRAVIQERRAAAQADGSTVER
jgi:hypothetical protein